MCASPLLVYRTSGTLVGTPPTRLSNTIGRGHQGTEEAERLASPAADRGGAEAGRHHLLEAPGEVDPAGLMRRRQPALGGGVAGEGGDAPFWLHVGQREDRPGAAERPGERQDRRRAGVERLPHSSSARRRSGSP